MTTIRSKAAATENKSVDKTFSKDWEQKWLGARKCCCDYQIAHSREQYRAAFSLVYDEYLKQDLTRPNRLGLRILPHQLLLTSSILVATLSQNVVATISLVEDGKLGLPMDDLYAIEIERMRQKGKRLAELTCLAHRHTDATMWNRGKVRATLETLIRHAANFAVQREIDDLVICVNPRHASFYQRRYGFTELGGPDRPCPWARNQPATPLWLDQCGIHAALRAFDSRDGKHRPNRLRATGLGPVSLAVTAPFWNMLAEVSPIPSWKDNSVAA